MVEVRLIKNFGFRNDHIMEAFVKCFIERSCNIPTINFKIKTHVSIRN
jgi:hypothetical protein